MRPELEVTDWIGQLVDQARTLDERLASPRRPSLSGRNAEGAAALARWARLAVAGDREAFARRLSWDGWDEAGAAAAFADPWIPASPLPGWAVWMERAAEECPAVLAGPRETAARLVPFAELWTPFLYAARSALQSSVREGLRQLSEPARGDLEHRLLLDLATWGAFAAYEDFERQGRRYLPFISACLTGRLRGFLSGRAALARRLAEATAAWVETTAELARRLVADHSLLAQKFGGGRRLGPVLAVETGLSEAHDGGRRVLVLSFTQGLRIVYKPRPVDLEAAFQDLLCWLARRGLRPALPTFGVIARPGYGWCEWVVAAEVSTSEEVERYFEAAGALLCLVEALGGDDLHAENVVATAAGPVLVDAETLLQPLEDARLLGAPPRLRSQLATAPQLDVAGRPYDLGGLQGDQEWLGEEDRRLWQDIGTDAMRIERGPSIVRPGANVLKLRGRPCRPAEHIPSLAGGFAAAYRFLMARRADLLAAGGPLEPFRTASSRVLLRASQQYAFLLARLREPRFQSSGLSSGHLAEIANRPFTADRRRPAVWDLIREERGALERGDIPRFEVRADSTAVEILGRPGVQGCFAVSGWEALAARLERLSEADLAGWLWEIRRLRRPAASTEGELPDLSPASLAAQAVELGRRLFLKERNGAPGSGRGERGLYGGALGKAVLAAALARETGDPELSAVALELARGGRGGPRRAGGRRGGGGGGGGRGPARPPAAAPGRLRRLCRPRRGALRRRPAHGLALRF